jgi:hypothetical protein
MTRDVSGFSRMGSRRKENALGGAVSMKARVFRAAVSAAMVAAVVQSLGAAVKW